MYFDGKIIFGGRSALCGLSTIAMVVALIPSAGIALAQDADDIMVTGTRIRGGTVASPVVVIDEEQILRRGAATAEDVLRLLPQNLSSLSSSSFAQNSQSTESLGESAPNLRGLGNDATLVLINGRRIAGSANFDGSTFNIANIPASAILRVEVMLDGASAIYGSDAIGGVINIILKHGLPTQFETSVRQEIGENGGNRTAMAQTANFGWNSGHLLATANYGRTNPVTARKFGLTTMDYRAIGGDDFRITGYSQPGVVFGYGSLPATYNGIGYSAADFSTANIVPVSNLSAYVRAKGEDYGATLSAEQQWGASLKFFADGLYSHNETVQIGAAPALSFAYVPATNPYNLLGEDAYVSYLFANEVARGVIPRSRTRSINERIHLTAGLEAKLPLRDWRFELSGLYSREDAVSDSYGISIYSQSFNDALSGTTTATALNLFGNGTGQNDALLRSLVGRGDRTEQVSVVKGASLKLDGGLLDLPGGVLRFAVGAEYRDEKLDYSQSPNVIAAYNSAILPREIRSIYGQLDVPILSTVSPVGRLTATLAGRSEKYRVKGDFDADGGFDDGRHFSRFSPQWGLLWQPAGFVKLRATYGQSFRAPDPKALFLPRQGFGVVPIFDYAAPGGATLAFPNFTGGGNPDLKPETARTWTLGLDLTPRDFPLSGSISYNNTRFQNMLGGVADLLFGPNAEYLFAHPDLFPGVLERDASGSLTGVNMTTINYAGRKSESIDFSVNYARTIGDLGTFRLGFSGVYTIRLTDQPVPGLISSERVATLNGIDRFVSASTLDWERHGWTATFAYTTRSSYRYTVFDTGAERKAGVYGKADLTVGYRFGEDDRLLKGLRIIGGVRNLIGNDLPYVGAYASLPYDVSRGDVRGRTAFLELRKAY